MDSPVSRPPRGTALRARFRRTAGLATAVVVAATLAIAAPASATDPERPTIRLDAGPSNQAVAPGFQPLDRTMAYTAERGYGFVTTSGLDDRNRGVQPGELGAMTGDFVISGAPFEIRIDLPDGSYDLRTWSGDTIASSNTSFEVDGVSLGGGQVASGLVAEVSRGSIVAEGGHVIVRISGNSIRLNGLEFVPTAPPADDDSEFSGILLDAGPVGAPVAPGWTALDRSMTYTPERGFGFANVSGLNDRLRGAEPGELGDMIRDFVISGAPFELLVDVPNGTYDVRTWSGDTIASSQTTFAFEGQQSSNGNAASGFVTEVDHGSVTVTDGQLNVLIGGNSSRFNGISIIPTLLAPTGLAVTSIDLSTDPSSVMLGWDAADDVTYRVLRTGEGDARATVLGETAEPSFTDSTARLGRDYRYAVVALSEDGRQSVPSEELLVGLIDPDTDAPAAPSGLAVTDIDKNLVELSWAPVEGARYYLVQRAPRADAPFLTIGESASASYSDTDILTTLSFFYRVIAVNEGGSSEPSEVLQSEAATVLQRQTEYLDRSPSALPVDEGVLVSWRLLGTDDPDLGFHVYRDGVKITDAPITDSTNLLDPNGAAESTYLVTSIQGDREVTVTETFGVWHETYFPIPLNKPEGGTVPGGQQFTYSAGDATVADLTGDGKYEFILIWVPSNQRDNSQSGYTGNVLIDAYTMEGEQLWRIDMGRNIRAGAHYTMLQAFDYDGDGKAELVLKTADATVDGQGVVIGNPDADFRNSGGYILSGPEFLTLFDGETGGALHTIDYTPPRGNVGSWGDTYGNRVDRFLAGTAYLDGETPSVIFSRGYYTRTVLAAYDVVDKQLVERWVIDSDTTPGAAALYGQGNHQLSIADVDGDGRDEIIFGQATVNHDGTLLYSTGLGHGDALHVGNLIPDREGLEVFGAHESMGESGNRGATMRDAATGEIIWAIPATRDTGRAAAADIDPRFPGAEGWAIGGDGSFNTTVGQLRASDGSLISNTIPAANFVAWWTGDTLREIVDHDWDAASRTGVPVISKWNWETEQVDEVFRAEGTFANNGTKGTPVIQADLFGDWREEIVWRDEDSTELRIYATPHVTDTRIHTLMHDSQYRLAVAWQNVSYNQPPHPSFFIGHDMERPAMPPVAIVGGPTAEADESAPVITGVQDALLAESATLDLDVVATDPESGVRTVEVTFDGERVAADASIALDGLVGERALVVTAVNNQGLTSTVSATITVFADEGATVAPARGNLSTTSGWDYGLADGHFAVMMNLWWGENGSVYRLYQDGELIDQQLLTPNSPNAQLASTRISGLPNGRYVFTGELINAAGVTATTSVTVVVRDAAPGVPVVSHTNHNGKASTYTVTTNLWWGTNATSYRLLENGDVVDEQELVAQTPLAQSVSFVAEDRAPGTYTYVAEFVNAAGVTESRPVTVRVR